MGERPFKPCNQHGCGKLTKERFCDQHKGKASEQRKFYDQHRDNPLRKLYRTARWTFVRMRVLIRDPICKVCNISFSKVCDHVIPAVKYVAQYGGDINAFFDEDNLAGLCHSCHNEKTSRGE